MGEADRGRQGITEQRMVVNDQQMHGRCGSLRKIRIRDLWIREN